MATSGVTHDEVVRRLGTAESRIRALGVRRLALFGSVLRGTALPDSDVDLLVEFAPGEKSAARFFALYDLLESLIDGRVELVTTESLSPYIGDHIVREARDVFRASPSPSAA